MDITKIGYQAKSLFLGNLIKAKPNKKIDKMRKQWDKWTKWRYKNNFWD